MLRKIGFSSDRAFANAASPHGNQSTGLSACCRRYGDFSRASELGIPHAYRFGRQRNPAFRFSIANRETLPRMTRLLNLVDQRDREITHGDAALTGFIY